jgi:hypothetical protein
LHHRYWRECHLFPIHSHRVEIRATAEEIPTPAPLITP